MSEEKDQIFAVIAHHLDNDLDFLANLNKVGLKYTIHPTTDSVFIVINRSDDKYGFWGTPLFEVLVHRYAEDDPNRDYMQQEIDEAITQVIDKVKFLVDYVNLMDDVRDE